MRAAGKGTIEWASEGTKSCRVYWEYGGGGSKCLMVEAADPSAVITGAVVLIQGIAELDLGFPPGVANAAAALIDALQAAGFGPLPPPVRVEVDKKVPSS